MYLDNYQIAKLILFIEFNRLNHYKVCENHIYYFTNPFFAHFILFQRRTKMMPRMFSSSKKAHHIPTSPHPQ